MKVKEWKRKRTFWSKYVTCLGFDAEESHADEHKYQQHERLRDEVKAGETTIS